MTDKDRCVACPAEVSWRTHVRTGTAALVNAEPDPAGNVVLIGDDRYAVLTKRERSEPGTVLRHTLHFATCPRAKQFRR